MSNNKHEKEGRHAEWDMFDKIQAATGTFIKEASKFTKIPVSEMPRELNPIQAGMLISYEEGSDISSGFAATKIVFTWVQFPEYVQITGPHEEFDSKGDDNILHIQPTQAGIEACYELIEKVKDNPKILLDFEAENEHLSGIAQKIAPSLFEDHDLPDVLNKRLNPDGFDVGLN